MERIRSLAPHAARLLLGLVFFVFGLNGFLGFIPNPPHAAGADAFLGALAATGYMFPLIKGTEVVAGLLLLTNRFVPLALVLLAPVIVNIVLFHALLDPAGMVVPIVVLALELALAWAYRDAFRAVLAPKTALATATPSGARKGAHQVATV
ncbi:MAG: DoxX family protein [Myxococcota bacterium]|nr:DoxX family protein [Myxococcota bacterium]